MSLGKTFLTFLIITAFLLSTVVAQCDLSRLRQVTAALTTTPTCFCGGATAVPRNIRPPIGAFLLAHLIGGGPLVGALPDPIVLCSRTFNGVRTRRLRGACCVSLGLGSVERCFPSNAAFRCEFTKVSLASSVCPQSPQRGSLATGLPPASAAVPNIAANAPTTEPTPPAGPGAPAPQPDAAEVAPAPRATPATTPATTA